MLSWSYGYFAASFDMCHTVQHCAHAWTYLHVVTNATMMQTTFQLSDWRLAVRPNQWQITSNIALVGDTEKYIYTYNNEPRASNTQDESMNGSIASVFMCWSVVRACFCYLGYINVCVYLTSFFLSASVSLGKGWNVSNSTSLASCNSSNSSMPLTLDI